MSANTSAEPLRCALYIRVSTEDQVEYSPDAQREALVKYARVNEMEILPEHIYVDEGKSGRSTKKRERFNDMIDAAKLKPRPFDVILCHKFDRFARNREDSVVYKGMLRKKFGVQVISITESMGEDNLYSGILEAMLEAMAEFFSLNLSLEVKKGMEQKAKRGEPQGMAPLGYKMKFKDDPKSRVTELEVVEEEAVFIRYIFDQFVTENKDVNVIARELNNKMGGRTKKGNRIGKDQIQYILRNPVYIGKLRWTPSGRIERGHAKEDSIVAEALHPAIISEVLFQQAQDKLAAREKIYTFKGRPYSEYRHWLSSLMKCSACGSTLMYKPAPSPAFQCKGYTDAKCDISHHISVRKAEKAILAELKAAFDPSTVTDFRYNIKRERTVDTSADELTAKQNQLNKISERMERARILFIEGIDSIERYKETRQKLEDEQVRIVEEIEILKAAPANLEPEEFDTKFQEKVKGVVEVLESDCPLEAKINAIKSVIEKIIYDKRNKTIEVYYRDM